MAWEDLGTPEAAGSDFPPTVRWPPTTDAPFLLVFSSQTRGICPALTWSESSWTPLGT